MCRKYTLKYSVMVFIMSVASFQMVQKKGFCIFFQLFFNMGVF